MELKAVEEEVRTSARRLKEDVRKLLEEDIDFYSESGLVQGIRLCQRLHNLAAELLCDMETLFWLNKLRKGGEDGEKGLQG